MVQGSRAVGHLDRGGRRTVGDLDRGGRGTVDDLELGGGAVGDLDVGGPGPTSSPSLRLKVGPVQTLRGEMLSPGDLHLLLLNPAWRRRHVLLLDHPGKQGQGLRRGQTRQAPLVRIGG
ncbi:hypothetical protein ACOMHN_026762 [Nucella lapillus]